MSAISYRKPQDWLAPRSRKHFGNSRHASDLRWLPAKTDEEEVRLSAAQVQQQIARTIDGLMRTDVYQDLYDGSWDRLANESTTMSYGALRALLRGETHMTLLQIKDLEGLLGPLLLISPQVAAMVGLTEEEPTARDLPGA